MLKTKREIKKWLNKHEITNYTINDDLTVDVDENVDLSHRNLTEMPIQFNKVEGNFYCDSNRLTSLKCCPKEVKGDFYCSFNQLTNLIGAPKEVNYNFYCDNNSLTSLVGAPEKVLGSFYCTYNKLTSLEHLPEIYGRLSCSKYLHDTKEYKIYLIGKKLKEIV